MKLRYLALALFPLTLAACQSGDIQKLGDTAVKVLQQQGTAEQTLNAYQWSFQPTGTKQPIVLSFKDQKVGISSGCNNMFGGAKVENGVLVTGNLASTNMMCSPELMKQEAFAASLFQSGKTAFVLDTANSDAPTLTLISPAAGKVVFTGKLTPEAKYQSAGETIFLEISPQTKSCTGVAPQTCLQVREIKYAENGVKTQVDKDWTLFYSNIDGFTHNPNERQVVRIKRYEIKNPAADQSKYAYVQDMIIEREAIKGSL
ncbi:META and DUF4377 domain-containing protein [Acinetobacter chinensis]|uniref:META and DUF4377 domain-containing protein n=1 Tax=Acinetobacter chinensis TaxID=2004650 RepID=A0ABU3WBI7_9GAMM|nr:META and DUF4377 domain-containing protein [Acinetobacter chinensis]MDV2467754.1 META and DUF4377 domain-containing protein [Acinetobacter chinensis]